MIDVSASFYLSEGYYLIDNAMGDEDCDSILAIYERHADDDYATILNLDRQVPDIRERVMKHRKIVETVERLVGSEVVGCQTFFLFKKPGTRYANQSFNPHQDNSYARTSVLFGYLAVAIALVDQGKDSGGLSLWPGTHKLGLLPFTEQTGYREKEGEKAGNPVKVPDGYEEIQIVLKKGQALVFDGNLIHASSPNRTDFWRPTVITNYLIRDADMIPGRTANRLRIKLR